MVKDIWVWFLGHRLRVPKKESFKLKITLFRFLKSRLYKFQCHITIFASLISASEAPVSLISV